MTDRGDPLRIGVLFAEALAAVETIWSLRDAGHEVIVIARCGSRPAATAVRDVQLTHICAPEVDLDQSRRDLARQVSAYRLDLLFPVDDIGLQVSRLEPYGGPRCGPPLGCRVLGPAGDRLQAALDKPVQLELAQQEGFDVPKFSVFRVPELPDWPHGFPVVLKPAEAVTVERGGVTKGQAAICADREEMHRAAARLPRGRRYIAQQYVNGHGRGVFGLMVDGQVVAWSGHRRVRMMNPAGSGSSACAPQEVPAAVRRSVERFLRSLAWEGLFMVELLHDDDEVSWFVELNGRPWGSMALATHQGLDYPAWAVELALDPAFRPAVREPPQQVRLCRNAAYELLHLLFVMRGARGKPAIDWPRRRSSLREVATIRSSDHWYNARRGERRVLMRDLAWTLGRRIRR